MTASEIGDPMGEIGTGAGVTVKETQKDSITETAQDLVTDMVEVDTVKTAGVEVREGAMVQTPTPPTKKGRKFGAAVRTVGKEVGWRINNDGLGGRKRYL